MLGSPLYPAACLCFALQTYARTVSYDWRLHWVSVNPDGELLRPAIGINGQWPNPAIEAEVGDRIVINLHNQLGNETASLHFHGIYQEGSNGMDGSPTATQCEIPPGVSFTYDFVVNQPGSYWYHSHSSGQLADGLRGPLIIKDPKSPYAGNYSEELIVTISDWYHDEAPSLIPYYLSSVQNPSGAEPIPNSSLINEAQDIKLAVKPNTNYLIRIISMAAFAQAYVHFDQHEMTIIAIDGIYVRPRTVSTVHVVTAQRYDVLLTTKSDKERNYAFFSNLDQAKFQSIPGYLRPNATGYLVYDASKPVPPEAPTVGRYDIIDDFTLIPCDGQPLLSGPPDASIVLNVGFFERDGQNRAGFNNITYIGQKVPSLYTALTTGSDAEDPRVYGVNANAKVVKQGDLVEVVINNFDRSGHPMHLHGHAPQIVARAAGVFLQNGTLSAKGYTGDIGTLPKVPMRRDTWGMAPGGYTVIRYRADNPGVWLLHCHMEWHVAAGLSMTIVEAPLQLQQSQRINPAMEDICKSQGLATAGNAAGNTEDHFDLSGANTIVEPNHRGALVDEDYNN
ncbi:hypothetical protein EPUS_04688 [Endocarpon pusillum Z07020]|uniref:Uncharacterized protein n=1 Tax=Endocarpon pusillum (strain Z07020 / HMAS-L-300199) TaxID=1263415 RepID=U1HEV0_ENDPU|nr:uncharacterized protein EPUS_04688 [Endocarpon pusillum Z07020]ERF68590.1 hypothetical protein EPUS_04688 [Endocarpon pusillum Z07020]